MLTHLTCVPADKKLLSAQPSGIVIDSARVAHIRMQTLFLLIIASRMEAVTFVDLTTCSPTLLPYHSVFPWRLSIAHSRIYLLTRPESFYCASADSVVHSMRRLTTADRGAPSQDATFSGFTYIASSSNADGLLHWWDSVSATTIESERSLWSCDNFVVFIGKRMHRSTGVSIIYIVVND